MSSKRTQAGAMYGSLLRQTLLLGVALASLLTLVKCGCDIVALYPFSMKFFLLALAPLTALFLSPYALLWVLLGFAYRIWLTPVIVFVLVVAPAPIFWEIWRFSLGLEYVFVPVIQVVVALLLLLVVYLFQDRLTVRESGAFGWRVMQSGRTPQRPHGVGIPAATPGCLNISLLEL